MIDGKKIGIWGFGIVGKSALPYFLSKTPHIQVLDAKHLSLEDQQLLGHYAIPFYEQHNHLQQFLDENDYILASPGIDLRPYSSYSHKWVTELDIMQQEFKKPIIAITGSVGKTSITSILSQIFQHHNRPHIYTGGNIGHGMLSLAHTPDQYDGALLEVSSFQLEHCKIFAPDLAIWTTFYPNHLDRHGTLQAYFDAKFQLIARQQSQQQALIPASILPFMENKKVFSEINVLCDIECNLEISQYKHLPIKRVFFIQDNILYMHESNNNVSLFDLRTLPSVTFKQNWLIILSSLYLAHRFLAMPSYLTTITQTAQHITLPEHRLELVTSYSGISIFNDSKATTPASTLAAVHTLQDKPIILLLGGLSKGIDRRPFIEQLKNKVHSIVCFGKEAEQLKSWCDTSEIPAYCFSTLEEAASKALTLAQNNTYILFSPAGSSFDLFKDYQERGTYFKNFVHAHMQAHKALT
jgi:UDP-N-acetylmuramoylalanine--D-glutamate ligase